jgi:hypothetical protein
MPNCGSSLIGQLAIVAAVVASSFSAIAQQPPDTMTNATMAETVVGNEVHVLTIKYRDG